MQIPITLLFPFPPLVVVAMDAAAPGAPIITMRPLPHLLLPTLPAPIRPRVTLASTAQYSHSLPILPCQYRMHSRQK